MSHATAGKNIKPLPSLQNKGAAAAKQASKPKSPAGSEVFSKSTPDIDDIFASLHSGSAPKSSVSGPGKSKSMTASAAAAGAVYQKRPLPATSTLATKSAAPKKTAVALSAPRRPQVVEDGMGFLQSASGKSRKTTADGLKIYSVDELGVNVNSGGTPLCPFDCDCCF